MFVGFVVYYVGSGLCDELNTRSDETYQVCVCLIVCDLENSILGDLDWRLAAVSQFGAASHQLLRMTEEVG